MQSRHRNLSRKSIRPAASIRRGAARRLCLTALTTVLLSPVNVWGQSVQVGPAHVEIGAQAIGVLTKQSPAIHGRDLTEGYLTQPMVMATASFWNDAVEIIGALDFEGVTLERGELNAGILGEGYIDRRHPHTYLHELVITAQRRFGLNGASVTLGKGFAPFGTDDPMARPFEKYPINHHLAQILERAVAIGAFRTRRVILEAGLFNGDEPESPGDVPNRDRYWDSWSGRLTLVPFHQGEIQTSYARVRSPENASGGGEDQRKQSASIRLEDAQHSGYGLLEWARTTDYVGSTRSFAFTSLLAETSARYGVVSGGLRFERTERPDEERQLNEFRTAAARNRREHHRALALDDHHRTRCGVVVEEVIDARAVRRGGAHSRRSYSQAIGIRPGAVLRIGPHVEPHRRCQAGVRNATHAHGPVWSGHK